MTPKRFKSIDELTTAEHIEYDRTGKLPETDEYREARRRALENAGLEPDDDGPSSAEEMSVADHVDAIRRRRSR